MNIGLYKHDSEYIFTKRFPSITGEHIYYTYSTKQPEFNLNTDIWILAIGSLGLESGIKFWVKGNTIFR